MTTAPETQAEATASPNGDLPPIREALVAQAERVHQEILHERDTLRARLLDADTAIAGLKAQLSVAELTASQLQNRMDSTMAVRDEAVARRAAVEAILASMMAIGRAFQIENTPLVRETTEEEAYAENLSRDSAVVFNYPDVTDGKGGRK